MGSMMSKQEAKRLVDMMPENATWDDLIHEIYVREVIERGLEDSSAGRTVDVQYELMRRICKKSSFPPVGNRIYAHHTEQRRFRTSRNDGSF